MLINPGDIADGVLANAIGSLTGMVMRPRMPRHAARDLDIAGWADTEALINDGLPDVMLELPELTDEDARSIEDALRADEVQAALQALLAARLTDAPETEAAGAREAVRLSLTLREEHDGLFGLKEITQEEDGPGLAPYAQELSDYYDRKICGLVGRLEGAVGFPGLAQVRNEAYNSRIMALLGTIADMMAALAHPDRGGNAEAEFLSRYRRHARERHGKLQPPDFERRRRIPADKIYVNTEVYPYPRPNTGAQSTMRVMDLVGNLDRTVLLGDPGGGKTTAVNVLANLLAGSPSQPVPFVVTLREYAAADPPEYSVAGHIDHCLKTLYQCPAPDGLVERLLLTGRALVIFDGLDELLDTARRRDVSERVEQFCSAYPLTPVLVTSRLIGYDEAMLDESQFICFRLGGFGNDEIAEYAHKWFALQEGNSPAEAEAEADAFITESLRAWDVRSNPLLLSLMCILYRGAGTLPLDRPAIYAKCAELLLGRWDDSRRIRHRLRIGRQTEPAIQDLAWWLFTSGNSRAAVTEYQLTGWTTTFLHKRAFESEDEARTSAAEFTKFLRGRMWVLSDVGTTAAGEKLYAFTHRTFLEYFAAARLTAKCDTPEDLAAFLVSHILKGGGWRVIAELSLQIKSRTSDRGADRFYAAVLELIDSPEQIKVIEFLTDCLDMVDPSPGTVRRLTRVVLGGDRATFSGALRQLFRVHGEYRTVVADEMGQHIAARAVSDDHAIRIPALRLAFGPDHPVPESQSVPFRWSAWAQEQTRLHTDQIFADATVDYELRNLAVRYSVLPLADALQMPGGLGALLEGLSVLPTRDACGAVGRYLINHPDLPWARVRRLWFLGPVELDELGVDDLDEAAAVGYAALACIGAEWWRGSTRTLPFPPTIPLPARFRDLFRAWARGEVNFTETG